MYPLMIAVVGTIPGANGWKDTCDTLCLPCTGTAAVWRLYHPPKPPEYVPKWDYVSKLTKIKKELLANKLKGYKDVQERKASDYAYAANSMLLTFGLSAAVIGRPLVFLARDIFIKNSTRHRMKQRAILINNHRNLGSTNTTIRNDIMNELAITFVALKSSNSQELMFLLLMVYRLHLDLCRIPPHKAVKAFRGNHNSEIPQSIKDLATYYNKYCNDYLFPIVDEGLQKNRFFKDAPPELSQIIAEYTGNPKIITDFDAWKLLGKPKPPQNNNINSDDILSSPYPTILF